MITFDKTKIKSLIVIDKPLMITSMDVVRVLRRILKPLGITRIGYAGTLDPCASGVLIVGIGREGTRQLGTLTDQDKEYVCEIDLLKNSYSGDMDNFLPEYQMSLSPDTVIPRIDQIQHIIETKFTGQISQIPPALSAIKINGKKAYDLARKNIAFEMKERKITIHEIEILGYTFPVLKLRVKCSKGTYIRTLGKDIGRELKLWGTLISLRRTRSGDHTITDAIELNKVTLKDLIEK